MNHGLNIQRSSIFVWLTCIGLAALWDFLFWGHAIGASAAVFAATLITLLVARAPGLRKTATGKTLLLLALASLAALVEEPSPLALLMASIVTGLLILVAQHDWHFSDPVGHWLSKWLFLLATIPVRIILDNGIVARWFKKHPRAGNRLVRVARIFAWWILPLLAGGVFVALFALANPIIEHWLRSAFDNLWLIADWFAFLDAPRLLLWLVVAFLAYGILRYRRSRVRRRETPTTVAVPPVVRQPTSPNALAPLGSLGMILRCLLVFNAVFAVQSALDLLYLFGGATLPAGMTYAHYAHRGAYPLIATALLAGLFVLLTFKTNGAAHRSPWARRLVYAWIAQNIFLMISTIWRVWLYVDVYSLSRWRLAALIWIALVALGFLWIIARIALSRSNIWLWRMNVVTLFATLFLCAFINFDGLIADFNVRHCQEITHEGVPIDIPYLQSLGTESLPALHWLAPRDPAHRTEIERAQRTLAVELQTNLGHWHSWTFRRHRAFRSEYRLEAGR